MPRKQSLADRVASTRPPDASFTPEELQSPAPDTEARRRIGMALVIGLVLALVCMLALCGAAFATGGIAVIYLQQVNNGPTPQVAAGAPIVTPTQTATLTPTVPATVTVQATASVLVTPTASAQPTVTVTLTDTQRQIRIFREFWNAVNDNYVYPDFNGVDWPAARKTGEARIRAGMHSEQFYDMLRELVASLKDDHSNFLSPEEARQEEEDYQGTGAYVGIGILCDVNEEGKYAYVLQVLPDSPAEGAGIRAHDHILEIDGQPSLNGDGNVNTALLRGPEGTTVTVKVRTPGDPPRDIVMTRSHLSTSSPVEHRLLPGSKRIGYILIPTLFEEDIAARVRAALRQLMKGGNLDGLVVDMRINGGGAYPVLLTNLGFFTRGKVGNLVDRKGVKAPLTVKAERVGNSQTVPLVVLMGPSTQSYAEVFAGALRATGRARLIGQRSGGNVETLRAHRFEDGSLAWIAEESFRLPNGTNWEGKGLQPDVLVDKGWDEFTGDNDPGIAAATAQLSRGK